MCPGSGVRILAGRPKNEADLGSLRYRVSVFISIVYGCFADFSSKSFQCRRAINAVRGGRFPVRIWGDRFHPATG